MSKVKKSKRIKKVPDTKVITKWVAALNDRKQYRKIRNSMRYGQDTPKGKAKPMCCLGVLCDLYAQETGVDIWEKFNNQYAKSRLPQKVADWAGISRNQEWLAILNDDPSYRGYPILPILQKYLDKKSVHPGENH